jgi:hypothetical protein
MKVTVHETLSMDVVVEYVAKEVVKRNQLLNGLAEPATVTHLQHCILLKVFDILDLC